MATEQKDLLVPCCIHSYCCASDVVVQHLTATVLKYALSHCIGINVAIVGLKFASLVTSQISLKETQTSNTFSVNAQPHWCVILPFTVFIRPFSVTRG